jgi:hypothetical protein
MGVKLYMEEFLNLFIYALYSAVNLTIKLLVIIIPLTVSYEFLKLRAKPDKVMKRERKLIGIPEEGFIPLITGVFVGLTYGAGIIIHAIKHSNLKKNEAFLVLLFLSICHAIVEDTLIFVLIGANGPILVTARFILAFLITFLASRALYKVSI